MLRGSGKGVAGGEVQEEGRGQRGEGKKRWWAEEACVPICHSRHVEEVQGGKVEGTKEELSQAGQWQQSRLKGSGVGGQGMVVW